jgi:HAE1 family hydrophobic/amphiphilic exporter-1
MLIGLVGKNAILLVDRANQKRREDGLSAYDALIEAGKSRIRPILMTTTAMVIGMLPLAIAQDSGSEWKSGLAWAIIGGLISSMFLTLVLVPVIYMRAEMWKLSIASFFKKVFRRKKDEAIVPHVLQPEEN